MPFLAKHRALLLGIGTPLALLLAAIVTVLVFASGWPHDNPPPIIANFAQQHPFGMGLPVGEAVARTYPIGKPDVELQAELKREAVNFKCYPDPSHSNGSVRWCSAYADWHYFICDGNVDINWQANAETRITSLNGRYTHHCG